MERQLIDWIRQHAAAHPALCLGIGDDAAMLDLGGQPCVVTVDMLTDHVDFELAQIDPRRAGRKALAVNLSDLAAMAARPLAAVVAVVLPRQGGMELAKALYQGMLPLAEKYHVAMAGGDTNSWDGPLAVSLTLLGRPSARGPLRRSGARPGDRVVATGSFGGSLLGRHLDFEPRVHEATELHEHYELHAGIDVSDGLARDLAHLAAESGCGAVLHTEQIPVAEDARRLAAMLADGSTPLEHALTDGEDFELLLAVATDEARRMASEQPLDVPLAVIGEFVEEPGLWLADASGRREPLEPKGWEHELD